MELSGICVILVNYNQYIMTSKSVLSIQGFNIIKHIIIVDNNSTDNSYDELLKISNKKIEVIKCENNNGFASGNNFGVRYAREKYNDFDVILFLGTDVIVDETTIKESYFYLNNINCAAVGNFLNMENY